jgi:hypothetical protein
MKSIIINFWYRVLHYFWDNRSKYIKIWKKIINNPNLKIDGKLDLKEFSEYMSLMEESSFTPKDLDDENIVSGAIVWNNLLPNTSKNVVQNQQWPIDCVPRACIRVIRYNTDLEISQEQEQLYIDEMYNNWIISGSWSKISEVQNYLRKRIQVDYNVELVYFREDYYSDKYKELVEKWYAHALWGAISSEYVADFKHDWDIDIENYTFQEQAKYYHFFTNLPQYFNNQGNIVENYLDTLWERNVYKNDYIKTFASKWVFYTFWYFLVEKKNIDAETFEKEKEDIRQGEYRKLAWESVINEPDRLIETIRTWDSDEAVACLEIIADRRLKKMLQEQDKQI